MMRDQRTWVLVDIGNQRCKVAVEDDACFTNSSARSIEDLAQLAELELPVGRPCHWWVSSVHRDRALQLTEWIGEHRPTDGLTMLTHAQFPLRLEVTHPDHVGTDRLAAAAGVADRLAGGSAVVVDIGTAVTVDWVSCAPPVAVFHGGVILPGPDLAARALTEFTDALPHVMPPTAPVPVVGRDTRSAIESGLYWGLVGAVRELSQRVAQSAGQACRIYVTGGGGAPLAHELGQAACYEPQLVLRGIWRAAAHQCASGDVDQRRR